MVENAPNDKAGQASIPALPRGETWVPRRRGVADRLSSLPKGPTLLCLAAAGAAGALLLLAKPDPGRFPHRLRTLRASRRKAHARSPWVGVLASAGRALASTVVRGLAEDLIENTRRRRAEASNRSP